VLSVRGLEKSFVTDKGPFRALRGVSFQVEKGQFFTLLGPSGCGKTTALHCIAGLETPDCGEIVMGDTTVFSAVPGINVPTHKRRFGMVFQSYAIWPHMTVYENVAFPLVHGQVREAHVQQRVMTALARVKLEGMADRPAPFLSGGQQQRVALARALVHEPPFLLLDEPLSNLDARLRDQMRVELRQLTEALGTTTIYVTHDQVEALAMSDRIALMRDGQIVQQGTPRDVYFRPADAFVATFLGGGNILPGRLVEVAPDRRAVVMTALGRLACVAPPDGQAGMAIDLVIRAEGFRLCDPATDQPSAPNRIDATVEGLSFLGSLTEIRLRVGDQSLRARFDALADIPSRGAIRLEVVADRCAAVRSSAAAERAAAQGTR
jgi:iron(III) transport system ATP-binding protein